MNNIDFIKEHIEQLEEAYESVSKLDLVEVKENVTLELVYFKKVLKDLEVLEILKDKKVNIPYLHSLFEQENDETIVWYYNLGLEEEEPRMKKITIDDFYKIKEWLENE